MKLQLQSMIDSYETKMEQVETAQEEGEDVVFTAMPDADQNIEVENYDEPLEDF